MEDLISKKQAINFLRTLACDKDMNDEAATAVCMARSGIDRMPVVDAVQVVRCRDCKHWGTGYGGETEHIKVCEYANYMIGGNGYCAYGERKMDAEVNGDD